MPNALRKLIGSLPVGGKASTELAFASTVYTVIVAGGYPQRVDLGPTRGARPVENFWFGALLLTMSFFNCKVSGPLL